MKRKAKTNLPVPEVSVASCNCTNAQHLEVEHIHLTFDRGGLGKLGHICPSFVARVVRPSAGVMRARGAQHA